MFSIFPSLKSFMYSSVTSAAPSETSLTAEKPSSKRAPFICPGRTDGNRLINEDDSDTMTRWPSAMKLFTSSSSLDETLADWGQHRTHWPQTTQRLGMMMARPSRTMMAFTSQFLTHL